MTSTSSLNPIKAGDTYPAWSIELIEDNGSPATFTPSAAVLAQIRTNGDAVVYQWTTALGNATIAANEVTLAAIPGATTQPFAVGQHTFELQITDAGVTRTWVDGSVTRVDVRKDYARA